ncbi:MAG TPA: ParB/RepB/Spo0J family partition protein [Oscillospiraceae bacterium]|nr:ParB/RepB/Spo0J family partition protein [Oscillospiraceae bacterium]
MITNIEVTKLLQHPDNPRKSIGDVTELAESIKARGILQNLTVVPAENGMYTVIIGHRRLAAAKQAGLTEVPCAVVDMDYKTQLSTMLLENMQRSDLTVYEQAQGMQMMFNLGVPVAEIVEKTGFAETTVRKRLKIATLPTEQMQQAVERGGTLENYVQIADIKDEKERRELLKVVGTCEFEFSLTRAKRRQIEAEKTPLVKAELKAIGAKAVKNQIYSSAYDWIERCEIADWKEGTFKKPKNKEELFWEISYGTVYLMRKKAKASKRKEEKSECELRIDSANRELMRLTKTAYECRVNFVKNFTAVEKHKETIIKWLVMFAGCEITDYCTYDRAYINSEIGADEKEHYVDAPKWRQFIAEDKRAPIVVTYALAGDDKRNGYYTAGWYASNNAKSAPEYRGNQSLDRIYEFLCELGYEMSETELQLQSGEHELLKGE